ncbi:MAG TPA: hypothetical protein VLB27_01075 [candidate division Zixibacteria bacterium]|nr:hypothetical protein [candidate division Zixibacteria bacterium]
MKCLTTALVVAALAASTAAQTRVNPDISAIGDFRLFSHTDDSRDGEQDRVNLTGPSLEIDVSGYLNPYSRADVAIAWHDENAEIEEVYVTILRGLPLGLNLAAGKRLLEFGRLNVSHEHVWPFIKRPLAHEFFFGPEGLRDATLRGSVLLPTGSVYTELQFGVTGGAALSEALLAGPPPADSTAVSELGGLARLTASLAPSETSELAFGVSLLNSPDNDGETRIWLGGLDVKYKNTKSRTRSLLIEAEALIRDVPDRGVTETEAFGYLDFRFGGRYSVGSMIEAVSIHENVGTANPATPTERRTLTRVGGFMAFLPVEETLVARLAIFHTDPIDAPTFWEVTAQLVFGLGPHKIHSF